LRRFFTGQRKTGGVDLEAVEMALRSALHQAGAAALSQLLQDPAPASDQRTLPCRCCHLARYVELRTKPLLTVLGTIEIERPYYLCRHCHGPGLFRKPLLIH